MLLFTLLTTLFFGSPTAPAKDTLPVVKPRPSIGLFYMTGPRAYGSNGFLGLEGGAPLTKSTTVYLAIGGDYSSYIDRNPTFVVQRNSAVGGNTGALSTQRITRGYLAAISNSTLIHRFSKVSLSLGSSIGYSQVYSSYEYDVLPTRIPNDTSTTRGLWLYSHQRSRSREVQFWVAPQIRLSYSLSKYIEVALTATGGYRRRTIDENFENSEYLLGVEYSDSPHRSSDPFNFTGISRKYSGGGYGYSLDGGRPKRFVEDSFLGFSNFSFTLNFFLR